MRFHWIMVAFGAAVVATAAPAGGGKKVNAKVVLVIHGGTGMEKAKTTPELNRQHRAGLEEALQAGYAVLKRGGSALDGVEAAIVKLEDNPLFNAGKGSVFTHEGKNELDASIMDGNGKRAGAVAAVTTIKNPIRAARAVMEKSSHVMLVGRGAEIFAAQQSVEQVEPSYFWTARRWDELQERLKKAKIKTGDATPPKKEWSTVGAVALDGLGNLAAGTSTGGMTNKRYGRVGDSPVIGAGTYVDNKACGVSATGHGEYFIRHAVAHEIVSLMKYKGLSVQRATDEVVHSQLKPAGGEGGVIALDPQGHVAMSFNGEGMYRGYITADGHATVMLYED